MLRVVGLFYETLFSDRLIECVNNFSEWNGVKWAIQFFQFDTVPTDPTKTDQNSIENVKNVFQRMKKKKSDSLKENHSFSMDADFRHDEH